MKTNALITIFIFIITVTAACGSAEPHRISGEVEYSDQGGAVTDSGAAASDSMDAVGDAAGNAGDNAAPAAAKGYVFPHPATAIVVDTDFAPILAALGEPGSYFEAASCAFEGLDKTYTYSGFEVDTYPQPEGDFVSAVVLRDDTVATAEGVKIGSSRADMEAAYGAGRVNDSGQIVYQKDGMRLCFILDGDQIISIEYQTMVLDE